MYEGLKEIVGNARVLSEGDAFESEILTTLPKSGRPLAIVEPNNVVEVQRVVKWANENKISVWPISQGKNWGYGSKNPVSDGGLILSLHRLNRIIEVNRTLCYALIEPGVTYRQLRQYLEDNHPDLWSDCTDGPPDGSVLGNALDRGIGVTNLGDHFGTLCGLEFITSEGECVKTGGGPPDCWTWNTHKWGCGPYVEGLFSQGNFGVVVKAGVWLMKKPDHFVSFTFDVHNPNHLPQVVDCLRELGLKDILRSHTHIINQTTSLAVFSQYPREAVGHCSRFPEVQREKLIQSLRIPAWTFGGGVYGTRAQVQESLKVIKRLLRSYGKLQILTDARVRWLEKLYSQPQPMVPRFAVRCLRSLFQFILQKPAEVLQAAPHIHSVLKGRPSDYFVRHAYFKSKVEKPKIADPDADRIGMIWFAPIAPMEGAHVQRLIEICEPFYRQFDFDFYLALLVANTRTMIVLQCIYYDQENKGEANRAQQLYYALNEIIRKNGYQCYRSSTLSMSHTYSHSPELKAFVDRMQRSIDPNGILAPRKYGLGHINEREILR